MPKMLPPDTGRSDCNPAAGPKSEVERKAAKRVRDFHRSKASQVSAAVSDNSSMTTPLNEAIEFACHFRSCAPPPVGKGGSRGGSGSGNVSRARRAHDVARRGKALRSYIAAKKAGDHVGMAKHVVEYRRARGVVADNKAKGDYTGRSKDFHNSHPTKARKRQTGAAKSQRALQHSAAQQQTKINRAALGDDAGPAKGRATTLKRGKGTSPASAAETARKAAAAARGAGGDWHTAAHV